MTVTDTDAIPRLGQDGRLNQRFIDIYQFGFVAAYDGTQETTIAFDSATYIFTLAPTGTRWHYYRNGVKYEIVGSQTVTLAGSPPAAGLYYIYIDATDGTLTASTSTPWTLEDTKVPVATVAWNNALTPKYWLADERHTCAISRRYHWEHHFNDGTEIITSPTLTGPTVAPGTPLTTDNTLAISQAVIADEDQKHILAALANPDATTAKYVVMYRTGASTWAWTLSTRPFVAGTNRIQHDNGAGTMVDGTDNYYTNYYLLVTNADFGGAAARFVFIPGQAEYQALASAQAESFSSLVRTGLPLNEYAAVYQLTWKTHLYGGAAEHGRLEVAPKQIAVSAASSSTPVSTAWGAITGTLTNQTDLYQVGTWSPSFTGFTATTPTMTCRYILVGKMCTVFVTTTVAGTSNATGFTMSAPFTAATSSGFQWGGPVYYAIDNGAAVSPQGACYVASGTSTIVLCKTGLVTTSWTNSGNKWANLTLTYEVA